MSSPNIDNPARSEMRGAELINLDDFNFSNITWKLPDPDNEEMAEAEIKISIVGKAYLCRLEKWIGNSVIEVGFNLFDEVSSKEYILQGSVQIKSKDFSASTSIARNPIINEGKTELPDGTGVIFYKKLLDFIKTESEKYSQGLLHKVKHNPKLGLTSDKWNKIFEPLLVERGYQKIAEGEWSRLYNDKEAVSLEELDLYNIPLIKVENGRVDRSNRKLVGEAESKVQIAGVDYPLKIEVFTDAVSKVVRVYILDIQDKEEFLVAGSADFLTINKNFMEVGTYIGRSKKQYPNQSIIPKGVGLELYKRLLDYISSTAAHGRNKIIHKVLHDHTKGLNSKRWAEIFEPVLRDRGYVKIKNGVWYRSYQPQMD
jgi:hypothetical protein